MCVGSTPNASHGLPARVAVGSAWNPRPIGSVALGTNSPRIGKFWLGACAGSTPYLSHGLPARVAVGSAWNPRPIGSVALGTNSPRMGNCGSSLLGPTPLCSQVTLLCGCRVRLEPSAKLIHGTCNFHSLTHNPISPPWTLCILTCAHAAYRPSHLFVS